MGKNFTKYFSSARVAGLGGIFVQQELQLFGCTLGYSQAGLCYYPLKLLCMYGLFAL